MTEYYFQNKDTFYIWNIKKVFNYYHIHLFDPKLNGSKEQSKCSSPQFKCIFLSAFPVSLYFRCWFSLGIEIKVFFPPAGNDAGSADSSAAEGDLHYHHTTPTSHQTPVLHHHVHRPAPKTHCNPANPGRVAVTKTRRHSIYHYLMDVCSAIRSFVVSFCLRLISGG